jgi:ribosomal protein S18 acetylase RimI-like enzyme
MMIERATREDLPEILRLQKLAFSDEAEFVRDPNIKPMVQILNEIEQEFEMGVILKYTMDGEILGSVRAYEKEGTCHINRLVVHPDHWREGIGKGLMREIERCYENAKRYELFTREDHQRTRPFYRGLGYLPFKTEKVSDSLTFVYLEKGNV